MYCLASVVHCLSGNWHIWCMHWQREPAQVCMGLPVLNGFRMLVSNCLKCGQSRRKCLFESCSLQNWQLGLRCAFHRAMTPLDCHPAVRGENPSQESKGRSGTPFLCEISLWQYQSHAMRMSGMSEADTQTTWA